MARKADMNGQAALAPPYLPAAEADLVDRARSGHAAAREELAERLRRPAYVLALHLTGNPDDALDVTQEALLRFFTTLGRFRVGRPVKPWLFRIVRNQAIDHFRRRKVRRAESLDDPDLSRQIVDPGPGPAEELRRAELRRRIWRGLSRLPAAKREILVLRDYHDLTYAEIAGVLEIPMGTVMSRLHAARRALGTILTEPEAGSGEHGA